MAELFRIVNYSNLPRGPMTPEGGCRQDKGTGLVSIIAVGATGCDVLDTVVARIGQ